MPVDVLPLPGSSISTKWKEPYASASINQKLTGIIAPGIYRGLRMIEDPLAGDRTLVVAADATRGDHVAVYENADGYSVTYRDSTSGDITISLSSYTSVTVIVAVFIDYTPGTSTTGSFRAYTQSEFNILSATVKDHLVILGTVNVPASGPITSSMISLLNRTLASSNIAVGSVLNAPLVRNPGFEIGEVNAIYAKSSLFWEKAVTVGTGQWRVSTADVDLGSKAIEYNVSSLPITSEMSQQIGVETAEGELFLVDVTLKQLKTISSGTIVFYMEWADVNDAILSTTTLNLDGGAIDLDFRTVSTIVPAPAGAISLRAVGIRTSALSPSGTGIFAYIDNVNVFVEPRDASYPYAFEQAFRQPVMTSLLGVKDPSTGFSTPGAVLRHDSAAPVGEGRLLFEPSNSGSLPPALAVLGRMYQLGSALLATESNALKSRVSADVSVAGSTEYTLMWESGRQGETTGTYTQAPFRMYGRADGGWVMTANARYDGTNWNKDVVSAEAFRLNVYGAQVAILYQDTVTTSWAEAGWLTALNQLSTGFNLFLGAATAQYVFAPAQLSMKLGTGSDQYIFTPTQFTHDANIVPASSDAFDIGSSTTQIKRLWGRSIFLGQNPTDFANSRAFNVRGITNSWQEEYFSRYFGVQARKGSRFVDDFFSETTVPDGWDNGSSGGGNVTVARDGTVPHTLQVIHDGANSGAGYIYTAAPNRFRLTSGFVARVRVRWTAAFAGGHFGFMNPTNNTNGICIGHNIDNVTSGGPYVNTAFFVGGTLNATSKTVTGATAIDTLTGTNGFSQGPGNVQQWYTFSVVGSTLYWSIHTADPDTELDNIDSGVAAPFGSAALTVPTGLWPFSFIAVGGGSGFGSAFYVDYVEIHTGGRDG